MNHETANENEGTPNGDRTQCHDLKEDRLKVLYELAKEVFKEEDNRRVNIDDKATRFIPILGILLGAAGFFGKWLLDQHLVPPHGKLDWLALACVVVVFLTIIVAWLHIVLALRIQEYTALSIDAEVIDYFWDNDLETIYTGYALHVLLPAFQNNKNLVNRKVRLVTRGHYAILIAACLLVVLLILVGAHAWLHSPGVADNSMPIGLLFWE